MRILLSIVGPLSSAAVVIAQQPPPAAAVDPGFTVPVHRALDGDGLWAAGPDYKAHFAGGAFTFYPWLGASHPRNLPWSWRTESVEAGGRPLPLERAVEQHGQWHVELRRGAVTERYEVRPAGVEQSFVVHRPPATAGDLVVHGRLGTDLRAAPAPLDTQQALVFHDAAGDPLVRYGEAWAFDAAGRRTAVTTRLDGDRVRLAVDGAWLQDATFPVTIDPLTQRWAVETVPSGPTGVGSIGAIDIAHSGDSPNEPSRVIVYKREFSTNDHDAYAQMLTPSGPVMVFSWLSTHSVGSTAIAYSVQHEKWVIGLDYRHAISGHMSLLCYFHDFGDLGLNTGTTAGLTSLARHYRHPDLGGSDDRVVLVYEDYPDGSPPLNPTNVEVLGRWLYPDTGTIGSPSFLLSDQGIGRTLTRGMPTVQQQSASPRADVWAVAWQEKSTLSGDDWDVYASLFDAQGRQFTSLVADGSELGQGQAVTPRIAAHFGPWTMRYEFLVAWLQADGPMVHPFYPPLEVKTRRFSWSPASLDLQPSRTVASIPAGLPPRQMSSLQLAADHTTASHWAVVYIENNYPVHAAHVARIGGGGLVTETAVLFGSGAAQPISPSVTYDRDGGLFDLAYGSSSHTTERYALYSQQLVYPRTAKNAIYGQVCGTAQIGSPTPPYAGHYNYSITLDNAPASAAAVLFLSLARASVPLASIGMARCYVNVDTGSGYLGSIRATTSAIGFASQQVPLPEKFRGDLYAQWAYFDPHGGTSLGVSTTHGLQAQVR